MEKDLPHARKSQDRGEKTRTHLLEVGIRLFARFGPEGVTTRQLAHAAGVNSAAIAYYFGGKEGYYLEVVKYLIDIKGRPLLSLLDRVNRDLDRARPSPDAVRPLFARFVQEYCVNVLTNPYTRAIASIVSREQLHPTRAFDIIYERAVSRLHRTFARLVGGLTGKSPEATETILEAHAILGQILLFRIGSETVCRRLGWDQIGGDRARGIAELVSRMALAALGTEPGDAREERRIGEDR